MSPELSNFFQFSLGAGAGNPNIVANSAFQFIIKDSIMYLKATLNAASAGATIAVTVVDDNQPKQPYPPAPIPVGQVSGSVTEFDPLLAKVRVKRGSNIVIAIANPAAAAGQVWVGLE